MGDHEGWAAQPSSGLLPNGLLPGNAASVTRALDMERWVKAEKRTADLIACIQPNPPSEERRNAVANYVQRLIMDCFPSQVFTFGSVPLKTYLPDGDIDLTAFSKNRNLKDTWAHLVRDMLEKEEKNENAEFLVKEVQYIQAEVKIIKCLVENIVVDISFNQLGGLCTLCFLEEVDFLVKQNHLFKRSIILIKAWCYYESRILGAHHGLISTYALETLVLYIFHVFNNSFVGPLEVLYRFLEFFSKFDWENFCVSLSGPVPISLLPDISAEPPRKDGGELLLSKQFLESCGSAYAVSPCGQENQGQPFVSKHFNVIDPLRENNNLGRSVSKGNFFRIRSAFAFGAKKLARLLDCPKEDLYSEINQFFMNTWDRHGGGNRPDAPGNQWWRLRLSDPEGAENVRNTSISKRNDNSSGHETLVEGIQGSCGLPSDHNYYPVESTSKETDLSTASQSQKSGNSNINNSRSSGQSGWKICSSQNKLSGKGQRSSKPEPVVNSFQGRHLFARTRSSPELTEAYCDFSSHSRHSRAPESGKDQTDSSRLGYSRKKNQESENLSSYNVRSSIDSSSVMHASSFHSLDSTADMNTAVDSYQDDASLGSMSDDFSGLATRGMQQEEQDLVNRMPSSAAHEFNGQLRVPLNLASGHLPLPVSSLILASMGYAQRNLGGMVPAEIPLIETPWGTNVQFHHGFVGSSLTHYFPGGIRPNPDSPSQHGNDNNVSAEINPVETEHNLWTDQERGSGGFDLENGGFEMHQVDDKQQSTSEDFSSVPSSWIGGSRFQQKFRETRSLREDGVDNSQYQARVGSQMSLDDRTTSAGSVSVSRASSVRSKTSSESSRVGPTAKVSKPSRENRTRKVAYSGMQSALSGKGKSVSEHSTHADADVGDWIPVSGSESTERDAGTQPNVSLHVQRRQMPGFEPAQTSGSDSPIEIAPLVVGPGSQKRHMDHSAGVNLAFYPTGPPVPFVAMLPLHNFQADTGASDASSSHLSGDEGLENNNSIKGLDSPKGVDQSEVSNFSHAARSAAAVEPLELKSDILSGDFASHLHNLQYGRFCQNSRFPAPLICPSPVGVPPVYLQGRVPWTGPVRPLASNTNIVNHLVSYGPRLVQAAAPLQSVSSRPTNVHSHYADEMPRHRSGTGTYFPNPKISVRERHLTSTRRGNYNHDRNDHHVDRGGGWNMGSKPRGSGRSHNRSQTDRPNSRHERSDRHWGSYRHETSSYPHHSQNGPIRSDSSQCISANMAYGMYQLPSMKQSGLNSDGHNNPSFVMLYPYDHNSSYGPPAEQLEFGSLGPMGFSAVNEIAHLNEGSFPSSGAFEEPSYHGASSTQMSSPDQPSSPHLSRGCDGVQWTKETLMKK